MTTSSEAYAERPIRVAIIGYGYAGRTFHAPLIEATPGLALVAVVSRDAARVHAALPGVRVAATASDVIDALDIDLLVVATPNDSHFALTSAALESGKHVVVDKPFTLTLMEARQLAESSARNGRLLSVFHNRRWDSDYLSMREAIAGGTVGSVAHFESHFDRFRPQVKSRWREDDVPGGGIWFDLGPHLVDQALQLFGLPTLVTANLWVQRGAAVVDDWAHVVLEYEHRRVVLHASMLVAGGSNRFVAHGDKGSLVKRSADRQESQLLSGMTPGAPGWGDDPDDVVFYDHDGSEHRMPSRSGDQRRYYAQIDAALRGRGANPVPPSQAIAVMAVIEAGVRSARQQSAVTLDLTSEERAAYGH